MRTYMGRAQATREQIYPQSLLSANGTSRLGERELCPAANRPTPIGRFDFSGLCAVCFSVSDTEGELVVM